MNDTLLQTAILGTGKKTLSPNDLLPALRPAIQNTPDAETALLNALAAEMIYQKAGKCGDALVIPSMKAALPETINYAPNEVNDLLCQLLQDDTVKEYPDVIFLLLQKYIDNKWIVSPKILPLLLSFDAKKRLKSSNLFALDIKKHLQFPKLLGQIIGNRGYWLLNILSETDTELASLLKDMATTNGVSQIDESVWRDGTNDERQDMFVICRRQQPDLALQWLSASWANESADNKLVFLRCLKFNLSKIDIPFLEQVVAEINALPSSKQKAKQCEMRKLAAISLNWIPESKNYKQLCDAVLACWTLAEKRHLLVLKKKEFHLELPTLSGFWSEENLSQQYGIEINDSSKSFQKEVAILLSLMMFVEPDLWCKHLASTPKEVLHQFIDIDNTIVGQKELSSKTLGLFTAVMAATNRYQNSEFITAIGQLCIEKPILVQKSLGLLVLLFPSLSPSVQQSIVQASDWEKDNFTALQLVFNMSRQPWDTIFSRIMLDKSQEYTNNCYYAAHTKDLIVLFAECLPLQAITQAQQRVLDKIEKKGAGTSLYRDYNAKFIQPLVKLHHIINEKIKPL